MIKFKEYVVYNSITNNLSDDKYDVGSPFNFIEYLNYIEVIDNNDLENFNQYKKYLSNWKQTNFDNNKDNSVNIKSIYLNFFNDLTLKYSTQEQRRFFNTIDFFEQDSLTNIIPFYRKKIVEILNYYREKRNTFQREIRQKQGKGSNFSVKDQIINNINNFFSSPDYVGNKVSLSGLRVDIELGYDTFNDYFDINPESVDASEAYTSNDINVNSFLDLDKALIEVLNKNNITISELNPYKLIIEFNELNTSLLQKDDFIDYKIRNNTDTYRVLFEAELSENLVGTDYFYLSTTNTGFVSGKLFEAKNKAKNLFNVNFPSTMAKEKAPIDYERSVGLFFNPTKFSILRVDGEFINKIKPQLIENFVYVFPDPNEYGDVVNLSNTKRENPFNFYFDNSSYKNISSSSSRNTVKSNERSHYFHSYQSLENRRIDIKNDGLYANSISQLINHGSINKIETDIYGNEYIQLIPNKGIIRNSADIELIDDLDFKSGDTLPVSENQFDVVEPLSGFHNKINSFKQIYVKDAITQSIQPLSSSNFNAIYNKFSFNKTLFNELTGKGILDINVYEDTYSIDLSSFSIIDVFGYDGNYIELSNSPLIIDKDLTQPNLAYITKDCYNDGSIYKFNISLSGAIDSNLFRYELYKFDTNKKTIDQIKEIDKTSNLLGNEDGLHGIIGVDGIGIGIEPALYPFNFNNPPESFNIVEIVNSDLKYNSYDNSYILITTFKNQYDSIVIHYFNYKIIDNKISIVNNELYSNYNNSVINTNRNKIISIANTSGIFSFLSGSGNLTLPGITFPSSNTTSTITIAYSGSVNINFKLDNIVQSSNGLSLYKAEVDYGDNIKETIYSNFRPSTNTLKLSNFNHDYTSFNDSISSTGSIKFYYENGFTSTVNLEVYKILSDISPLDLKVISGQKTNENNLTLNMVDKNNTLYNFIG